MSDPEDVDAEEDEQDIEEEEEEEEEDPEDEVDEEDASDVEAGSDDGENDDAASVSTASGAARAARPNAQNAGESKSAHPMSLGEGKSSGEAEAKARTAEQLTFGDLISHIFGQPRTLGDLAVGDFLDAMDTQNKLLLAQIQAERPGEVFIKYVGWDAKWSEWIARDSPRLRMVSDQTVSDAQMKSGDGIKNLGLVALDIIAAKLSKGTNGRGRKLEEFLDPVSSDSEDETQEDEGTDAAESKQASRVDSDLTAAAKISVSSSLAKRAELRLMHEDKTTIWESKGKAPHVIKLRWPEPVLLNALHVFAESDTSSSYFPREVAVALVASADEEPVIATQRHKPAWLLHDSREARMRAVISVGKTCTEAHISIWPEGVNCRVWSIAALGRKQGRKQSAEPSATEIEFNVPCLEHDTDVGLWHDGALLSFRERRAAIWGGFALGNDQVSQIVDVLRKTPDVGIVQVGPRADHRQESSMALSDSAPMSSESKRMLEFVRVLLQFPLADSAPLLRALVSYIHDDPSLVPALLTEPKLKTQLFAAAFTLHSAKDAASRGSAGKSSDEVSTTAESILCSIASRDPATRAKLLSHALGRLFQSPKDTEQACGLIKALAEQDPVCPGPNLGAESPTHTGVITGHDCSALLLGIHPEAEKASLDRLERNPRVFADWFTGRGHAGRDRFHAVLTAYANMYPAEARESKGGVTPTNESKQQFLAAVVAAIAAGQHKSTQDKAAAGAKPADPVSAKSTRSSRSRSHRGEVATPATAPAKAADSKTETKAAPSPASPDQKERTGPFVVIEAKSADGKEVKRREEDSSLLDELPLYEVLALNSTVRGLAGRMYLQAATVALQALDLTQLGQPGSNDALRAAAVEFFRAVESTPEHSALINLLVQRTAVFWLIQAELLAASRGAEAKDTPEGANTRLALRFAHRVREALMAEEALAYTLGFAKKEAERLKAACRSAMLSVATREESPIDLIAPAQSCLQLYLFHEDMMQARGLEPSAIRGLFRVLCMSPSLRKRTRKMLGVLAENECSRIIETALKENRDAEQLVRELFSFIRRLSWTVQRDIFPGVKSMTEVGRLAARRSLNALSAPQRQQVMELLVSYTNRLLDAFEMREYQQKYAQREEEVAAQLARKPGRDRDASGPLHREYWSTHNGNLSKLFHLMSPASVLAPPMWVPPDYALYGHGDESKAGKAADGKRSAGKSTVPPIHADCSVVLSSRPQGNLSSGTMHMAHRWAAIECVLDAFGFPREFWKLYCAASAQRIATGRIYSTRTEEEASFNLGNGVTRNNTGDGQLCDKFIADMDGSFQLDLDFKGYVRALADDEDVLPLNAEGKRNLRYAARAVGEDRLFVLLVAACSWPLPPLAQPSEFHPQAGYTVPVAKLGNPKLRWHSTAAFLPDAGLRSAGMTVPALVKPLLMAYTGYFYKISRRKTITWTSHGSAIIRWHIRREPRPAHVDLLCPTAVMCVLAQYNERDSFTLDELWRLTGLARQTLCQSLAALTHAEHPIVVLKQAAAVTPEKKQTARHGAGRRRSSSSAEEKASVRPLALEDFTNDAVFAVNHNLSEMKTDIGVVVLRSVRFEKRAGGSKAAGHSVQAWKENVLDAALVRVLKHNSGRAFSANELRSKLASESSGPGKQAAALASATVQDVSARLNRLFRDEYISRDEAGLFRYKLAQCSSAPRVAAEARPVVSLSPDGSESSPTAESKSSPPPEHKERKLTSAPEDIAAQRARDPWADAPISFLPRPRILGPGSRIEDLFGLFPSSGRPHTRRRRSLHLLPKEVLQPQPQPARESKESLTAARALGVPELVPHDEADDVVRAALIREQAAERASERKARLNALSTPELLREADDYLVSLRPDASQQAQQPASATNAYPFWVCERCTLHNSNSSTFCNACRASPPLDGGLQGTPAQAGNAGLVAAQQDNSGRMRFRQHSSPDAAPGGSGPAQAAQAASAPAESKASRRQAPPEPHVMPQPELPAEFVQRLDDTASCTELALAVEADNTPVVAAHVDAIVVRLADALRLPTGQAAQLLRVCRYNLDLATELWLDHEASLRQAAGLPAPAASPSRKESKAAPAPAQGMRADAPKSCPVCFEEAKADDAVALWCQHYFCKDCWVNYITGKCRELSPVVPCMAAKCPAVVTEEVMELLGLKSDSPSRQQMRRTFQDKYVASAQRLLWCKNKRCSLVLFKAVPTAPVTTCPACSFVFCESCQFPYHAPAPCSYMYAWEQLGGYCETLDGDNESRRTLALTTKPCPQCRSKITKDGGCPHMTCRTCKHEFCWACMEPRNPNRSIRCSCEAGERARAGGDAPGSPASRAPQFEALNRECTTVCLARDKARKLSLDASELLARAGDHPNRSKLELIRDAAQVAAQARHLLYSLCVVHYFAPERGALTWPAGLLPSAENEIKLFEFARRDVERLTDKLQQTLENLAPDSDEDILVVEQHMACLAKLLKTYHGLTTRVLPKPAREAKESKAQSPAQPQPVPPPVRGDEHDPFGLMRLELSLDDLREPQIVRTPPRTPRPDRGDNNDSDDDVPELQGPINLLPTVSVGGIL